MADSMTIDNVLSAQDLMASQTEASRVNARLAAERSGKNELDKDDFLKILVTQLQHQDPTAPMEDREFIAQMAQFSSLEQMTNMSRSFGALAGVLKSSEAMSVIGKTVEIQDMVEGRVAGVVDLVERGDYPRVLVNGKYFDYDQITAIVK